MFVDDFLIAQVKLRKGKRQYRSDKSQSPKRNVSDKFIREEGHDTRNRSMRSFLRKQKTLKLEDEKVGDICNFVEKNVKCVFVHLVVLTGFQAADDSPASDEFRSSFDSSCRCKTNPQDSKDEAGEVDKLRSKDSRDNKEKCDGACAGELPGNSVVDDRMVFS